MSPVKPTGEVEADVCPVDGEAGDLPEAGLASPVRSACAHKTYLWGWIGRSVPQYLPSTPEWAGASGPRGRSLREDPRYTIDERGADGAPSA